MASLYQSEQGPVHRLGCYHCSGAKQSGRREGRIEERKKRRKKARRSLLSWVERKKRRREAHSEQKWRTELSLAAEASMAVLIAIAHYTRFCHSLCSIPPLSALSADQWTAKTEMQSQRQKDVDLLHSLPPYNVGSVLYRLVCNGLSLDRTSGPNYFANLGSVIFWFHGSGKIYMLTRKANF